MFHASECGTVFFNSKFYQIRKRVDESYRQRRRRPPADWCPQHRTTDRRDCKEEEKNEAALYPAETSQNDGQNVFPHPSDWRLLYEPCAKPINHKELHLNKRRSSRHRSKQCLLAIDECFKLTVLFSPLVCRPCTFRPTLMRQNQVLRQKREQTRPGSNKQRNRPMPYTGVLQMKNPFREKYTERGHKGSTQQPQTNQLPTLIMVYLCNVKKWASQIQIHKGLYKQLIFGVLTGDILGVHPSANAQATGGTTAGRCLS